MTLMRQILIERRMGNRNCSVTSLRAVFGPDWPLGDCGSLQICGESGNKSLGWLAYSVHRFHRFDGFARIFQEKSV